MGAPRLKPGVVTGADYLTLVKACKDGGYALPAVNVIGTSSLNAVMEAAAKNRSDVIIQLSNGGAEFYAGKGMKDSFQAKVLGAVSAALHARVLAEHYGICVIMHTDHANKKLVPWVEGMIAHSEAEVAAGRAPLYSSHMLDLSEETIADNLSESARILKRLAKLGMSIEIELGVTGGEEDGVGSDEIDNAKLYTQPEDVLQAWDLLSPIGHMSVAASFGNVHGVYAPGNIKLRPEILKASQELVQAKRGTAANPLDLVFHGGSGSDKAQIAEALDYGVFKMNIDTDTQFAFANGVGKYAESHAAAFQHQLDPVSGKPLKKEYDPRVWLREGEKALVERLDEAFVDLRSEGKSIAAV